ncbi:MAG TPA: exodeoxyribonuclease VII small subunit [Candidatus Contendobacter sp.]|nr:exodeoxyribonuclease VII small subunit [Candidatus Contendobacter sp.]
MTAKKNSPLPFEMALAELESLVGQLEQGELTLDDALQRFDRGIALVRDCQHALQAAEQKVDQLIERNGRLAVTPFDALAG